MLIIAGGIIVGVIGVCMLPQLLIIATGIAFVALACAVAVIVLNVMFSCPSLVLLAIVLGGWWWLTKRSCDASIRRRKGKRW